MVHTETRPREAISFVRTGQRPSGDVNPSLFKTTHFICILKGDEVENEVGNRKEWARMGKLILKSKSCCPLASDLTRGTPFTPGLLQPYSSIFTKKHFTWENRLQRDASRSLHLAVIHYVSNEQMKCLITVL